MQIGQNQLLFGAVWAVCGFLFTLAWLMSLGERGPALAICAILAAIAAGIGGSGLTAR